MNNINVAVVPYRMSRNPETNEWVAYCRFCDFKSRRSNYPINAGAEVISHARKSKSEGGHFDPVSGLYYSPEKMEEVRNRDKERRLILGSHEDTMNLNQGGL
jgi:hypothetical protein